MSIARGLDLSGLPLDGQKLLRKNRRLALAVSVSMAVAAILFLVLLLMRPTDTTGIERVVTSTPPPPYYADFQNVVLIAVVVGLLLSIGLGVYIYFHPADERPATIWWIAAIVTAAGAFFSLFACWSLTITASPAWWVLLGFGAAAVVLSALVRGNVRTLESYPELAEAQAIAARERARQALWSEHTAVQRSALARRLGWLLLVGFGLWLLLIIGAVVIQSVFRVYRLLVANLNLAIIIGTIAFGLAAAILLAMLLVFTRRVQDVLAAGHPAREQADRARLIGWVGMGLWALGLLTVFNILAGASPSTVLLSLGQVGLTLEILIIGSLLIAGLVYLLLGVVFTRWAWFRAVAISHLVRAALLALLIIAVLVSVIVLQQGYQYSLNADLANVLNNGLVSDELIAEFQKYDPNFAPPILVEIEQGDVHWRVSRGSTAYCIWREGQNQPLAVYRCGADLGFLGSQVRGGLVRVSSMDTGPAVGLAIGVCVFLALEVASGIALFRQVRWWRKLSIAANLVGLVAAAVAVVFTLSPEIWPLGVLAILWLLVAWSSLAVVLPPSKTRYALPFVLLSPAIVGLCLLVIYPIGYQIALSFSNMSLYHFRDPDFSLALGWQNLTRVFSEPVLKQAWFLPRLVTSSETGATMLDLGVFLRTVLWTAIQVPCHVVGGLILAMLLNRPMKVRGLYRTLLVIPWALPAIVAVLAWRGEFHYVYGFPNVMIGEVRTFLSGLQGNLPALGPAIDWVLSWLAPVPWKTEPVWNFVAMNITNIWLGIPFMMVILLGGLQSIPSELYEAAEIDGASGWQQFRSITLPLLRPVLTPAVILGVIWTFNNFNVPFFINENELETSDILVTALFRAWFEYNRYGFAAMFALVIFAILLIFSVIYIWVTGGLKSVTEK